MNNLPVSPVLPYIQAPIARTTCPARPPGGRTTRRTPRLDATAFGHPAVGAVSGPSAPTAAPRAARRWPAPCSWRSGFSAGLDSPELERVGGGRANSARRGWPGCFMAGLHVVSVPLLNELHEATGEPSAAILQKAGDPGGAPAGDTLRRLEQRRCLTIAGCRVPGTRSLNSHQRLAFSRRRRGMPSGLVARVGLSAAYGEQSLPPIRVSR